VACVSDSQIQQEVQKALTSNPTWADGQGSEFFVFLGNGISTCSGSSCFVSQFCAYHGSFTDSQGRTALSVLRAQLGVSQITLRRLARIVQGEIVAADDWTAEDEAWLRAEWLRLPVPQLAEHLQRTPSAVRKHPYLRGLPYRPEHGRCSVHATAQLLGVNRFAVLDWCQRGLMGRRSGKSRWVILPGDLPTFLRDYRLDYDWQDIQPSSPYRELARRLEEADPYWTLTAVAAHYRLKHRATVASWVKRGILPSVLGLRRTCDGHQRTMVTLIRQRDLSRIDAWLVGRQGRAGRPVLRT